MALKERDTLAAAYKRRFVLFSSSSSSLKKEGTLEKENIMKTDLCISTSKEPTSVVLTTTNGVDSCHTDGLNNQRPVDDEYSLSSSSSPPKLTNK